MRKSKRLSALVLAVCLIISMIVPAVYAVGEQETVTYSFGQATYSNKTFNASYDGAEGTTTVAADIAANYGKNINWKYEGSNYASSTEKYYKFASDLALQIGFSNKTNVYAAFRIQAPAAGDYTLTLNYGHKDMGCKADMYLVPASVFEQNGLTGAAPLTNVNFNSANSSLMLDGSTDKLSWTSQEGVSEYVLAFNVTDACGYKLDGSSTVTTFAYMFPMSLVAEPVSDQSDDLEEAAKTQNYALSSDTGYEIITSEQAQSTQYERLDPNTPHAFPNAEAVNWTYLNSAYTYRGVIVDQTGMKVNFGNDAAKGPFVALQIHVDTAGSYEMEFDMVPISTGGRTQVYLLNKADYMELLSGYTLGATKATSLGGAALAAIYAKLPGLALNETAEDQNVLDSHTNAPVSQSIGSVDLEEGDYVLVFRCYGTTTLDSAATGTQLKVSQFTLKAPGNEGEEEEPNTEPLDYTLSSDTGYEIITSEQAQSTQYERLDPNTPHAFPNAEAVNWTYLNSAYTYRGVIVDQTGMKVNFGNDAAKGPFVALQIHVDTAGSYEMEFDMVPISTGGRTQVYLLNKADYTELLSGYTLGATKATSLGGAALAAIYAKLPGLALNETAEDQNVLDSHTNAPVSQSIGSVDLEEGDYVLVFRCYGATTLDSAATGTQLKVSQLTLMPPSYEEEGDQGHGGFDGGDGTLPVLSQIASEHAIQTIRCTYAATDVVGGHDYMYMLFNGETMLVYDLDTGKLVDTKRDVQSTPRGIYIDENHIVWICGSTNMLYKYDPFSKTGTRIEIPEELFPNDQSFNVHGLTGDGNGTLYFGTYNRVYIGKYDIASGKFSRISEELTTDGLRAGYAGIIIKDGYAYLGVDGNRNTEDPYTHWIIKYDLEKQEIVDKVSILDELGSDQYLLQLCLVGDKYLFGGTNKKANSVIIDISGESMKKVPLSQFIVLDKENPEDETKSTALPGIIGGVSGEINGKVYFMGADNVGLLEFDIATGTLAKTGIAFNLGLACSYGGNVTVDGLEGTSVVTFSSVSGVDSVDLVFYNPATGTSVTEKDYTKGLGSGNQLQTIELSEDGTVIYMGAYGTNKVIGYEVATGKIVTEFFTTSHQTDGMVWYNGHLYVGNYGYCSIVQCDLETGSKKALSRLDQNGFYQNRMFNADAGDDKVFFTTVPGQGRLGGMLIWYDIQENRIYVAAGPKTEDVYYTTAGDTTNQNWFNAATNEKVNFDFNGDGKINTDDGLNADGSQRFTGLIKNQSPNNIIYKDGYIIGSTTRSGGSGSQMVDENNSVLFVYDVEAMKVVCTYDVTKAISGLKVPVDFIEAIAADPEVDGKFWGVVYDTLFSFTVDSETKEISDVTEVLSMGKTEYTHGGSLWYGRDILFDGDFMYVVFGSKGLYMIERNNVNNRYLLLAADPDAGNQSVPKRMVQAADGNIYFIYNHPNLMVLNVANALNKTKDDHGVEKVTALLNALDAKEDITLEDEAAVIQARTEYDKLSDAAKAQVDITKLTDAEAVIKPLREAADKEALENAIGLIDAIGEVTLDSETAITAARTAYNALTEGQKAKITNYAVLTEAEATLAYLKIPAEDKAAAAAVVEKIDRLGAVTMDSKAEIEAARIAYDALTELQKSLVTNLEKLTVAESAYEKLAASAETIFNFSYQTACTEMGLNLTGGNNLLSASVQAGQKVYYDEGKFNWYYKAVSSTLTHAQFNANGYLMSRSKPGDWVAFVIDNPGEGVWKLSLNHFASYVGAEEMRVYILPADTADIEAAMTEENLLKVVTCYDPENVVTGWDKIGNMDKPAADTIIEGTSLGYWEAGSAENYIVVFKCDKASEEALAAHAAIEGAVGFGSNLYISQLCMNLVDEEIIAMQETIDAMVDADKVTLESEAEIAAVRAAYDKLGNYQKSQVDATKLEAAEAKLAELKLEAEKEAADKAAAAEVTAKIEAIGTVTLESEEAIKAARAAYETLTDDQKALVNADKLTAAEAKLDALKKEAAEKEAADKAAAGVVQAKINNIGTVTLESEASIKDARAAYDALTAEQKKLVDTEKLEAAEAKLAELKLEAEKEAADKAAADAVIAQIDAIGTVTLESKAAIEAARAAYNKLTAEQKALVSNLNVLTAAEASLAALENPKTGDTAPAAIMAAILIAGAAALAVLLIDNKKKFANR